MKLDATKRKRKGQAVVEFAIASTLIFLLLSAAIDLGLVFFSYQALAGAAQEGASYGSVRVSLEANSTLTSDSSADITARVRNETYFKMTRGGNRRKMGIVDMLDLNNDGNPDTNTFGAAGSAYWQHYIWITAETAVAGVTDANCQDPAFYPKNNRCRIVVQVTYEYKPFFFFAPAIGSDKVEISARRSSVIRSLTQ